MMATSPTSSAVSAAADVWTSRSGEPSNSRRFPTSEIRGRLSVLRKRRSPRLVSTSAYGRSETKPSRMRTLATSSVARRGSDRRAALTARRPPRAGRRDARRARRQSGGAYGLSLAPPPSARHPAWVAGRFLSTQALGSLTTLWAFCARRGCRCRQDGGVAAVGKLVRAPTRCPRGHALRPDRTLLRTVSCSCGRHTTWRCHCGEVIYRPVLSEHCRLLNGRASTRRGQ